MAKVVRSPNYPVISLDEAVSRAQMVYKKENRHPVPRESLAKAIGYNTLNGASISIISALSKYGLLESAGPDQLKISPEAVDIVLRHPGEPERVEALQRAAFRPALFEELHNIYGDEPPSDHTLAVYLQKKGFNPNTVSGVIRSYRDTMEFVNGELRDAGANVTPEPEDEEPMQTQLTGQSHMVAAATSGASGATTAFANDPSMRAIQLPYSFTEWATLQAAFPLSEDAWNQMITVLNAMKPVLVAPPEKQERQTTPLEQVKPLEPLEPAEV